MPHITILYILKKSLQKTNVGLDFVNRPSHRLYWLLLIFVISATSHLLKRSLKITIYNYIKYMLLDLLFEQTLTIREKKS